MNKLLPSSDEQYSDRQVNNKENEKNHLWKANSDEENKYLISHLSSKIAKIEEQLPDVVKQEVQTKVQQQVPKEVQKQVPKEVQKQVAMDKNSWFTVF